MLSAVFTASLGLLAFWYGYRVENDLSLARTYAFTGIVYAELLRSLGLNNPYRPVWNGGLAGNPYLVSVVAISILLQFAILHLPAVYRVFAIQATSAQTCLILLLLASIPLVMMEWGKQWTTKSTKQSPAATTFQR